MQGNNRPEDNEQSGVDEYYDYLPADHPLMAPLQVTMETKLRIQEENLRLEHKEKTEERKRLERKREEIGVNLYTFQQQYAKMQDNFDTKLNKLKILEAQRGEIENSLAQISETYNLKHTSVSDQEKTISQASEELNQLNRMLKYVEDYNKQIVGEIKLTGRNVNKAELTIKNIEKDKLDQDLLINSLMEQIKIMTEKKQLYDGQLKSQVYETQQAKDSLNEANEEIQIIMERKKNMLKDWDKSVISMKSRDKALSLVRQNIQEQDGEKLKLKSQIHRYNELEATEIFTNSEITHSTNENILKQKNIRLKTEEIDRNKQKLENKNNLLEVSTTTTKTEIKKLQDQENTLNNEIASIEKNKTKLFDEAKLLNDKNLITLSSKETKEKQSENLEKLNNKLDKYTLDIIVEIEQKQNEIARVDIDIINFKQQNEYLKKRLKSMDSEINKLEEDYSSKESAIKKNHEDLEKKQLNVDALNKKLGNISKNKGGEEEGLFEEKIRELKTLQNLLKEKIQTADDDWIQKKTTLVDKENNLSLTKDEIREKKAQQTIMEQKKLRLAKVYNLHEKEIRDYEILLKNLGYDMRKYNTLLSKNIDSKTKLTHQYFDVEIEFKEKLRQMENNCVKLELEIEVLREEKAETLSQILEIERQIQLWERKIKLEESMQVIIKPDKGIKEIEEMKTFIHRQELIYSELVKKQEAVIKGLEMCLQRRDYIKIRYPVEKQGKERIQSAITKGSGILPMISKDRDSNRLVDDLKFNQSENVKYSKLLKEKRGEFDKIRSDLYQLDFDIQRGKELYNKNGVDYNFLKMKKNSYFYQTIINQKNSALMDDFLKGALKARKQDELKKEKLSVKQENDKMVEVIEKLKEDHPHMKIIFDEILNLQLN